MKKIAIFASGAGTNALNLLKKSSDYPNVKMSCLIVENDKLAKEASELYPELAIYKILPSETLKGAERKAEHEGRILEVLSAHQIDHVLLAGWMRIIGPSLLVPYKNRIVNIHPSILPAYPGVDSYRRAFEDRVKESGVTIHLVDEGVDTGPIILQKKFPRFDTDTLDDFINRGKSLEWELYPQVLRMLGE